MATSVNAVLAWLIAHPGPRFTADMAKELGTSPDSVRKCLRALREAGAVVRVPFLGLSAYEWTGVKPEGVYLG